ncbi:MAG TPA: type II toxin-antitoxin system RelE/ParE family toxin [Bradyrhizobium sp.]|nr:type II toxin-antitoxin system RelE/ParE family toxin [Bradyrhizobium sp.]
MVQIIRTDEYASWSLSLRDDRAKAKIALRIDRLAFGNPGDVKPIGDGVSEMRIDYGPGYRVYYGKRGNDAILLLCGGTKNGQSRDIKQAKAIFEKWKKNRS